MQFMNLKLLSGSRDVTKRELLKNVMLLFSVLFFYCVSNCVAQTMPYSFSSSVGSFNALTSPTTLSTGASIDNTTRPLNIPFSFSFNGVIYTKLYVSPNGYISFGNTVNPGLNTRSVISDTASGFGAAAAFACDLQGVDATSQLAYRTTGTTPNRVLTIQWKNLTLYGATGQSFNFQVKLYETTSVIQFIYGSVSNTSDPVTVQVGLRGNTNVTFFNRTSTFNWAATNEGIANTDACTVSNTVFPQSGLTLTYTPVNQIITTGTLSIFSACTNSPSAEQTFNVSSNFNTTGVSIIAPIGFEISTTSGSAYNNSLVITPPSPGLLPSTPIYIRMISSATPTTVGGNIVCYSLGADTSQNLVVSGSVSSGSSISAVTGLSSVNIGSSIILSDSTIGGVWSSDDTTKALVTNTGMVTGISAGNSVISYTVSNSCGTAAALHNITVNGGNSTPCPQIISTVAGTGTSGYTGDGGSAITATLNYPQGVVVDNNGNFYIADAGNSVIRKVTASGIISTVAGNGTYGYSGDGGPATASALNYPQSIAVDGNGNLFIADNGNYCIRKVSAAGVISTIAGNNTMGNTGDGGAATAASLISPISVAVDAAGNVYVGDQYAYCVRKISTTGIISRVAGTGTAGYSSDGGSALVAALGEIYSVAVDGNGNLFIGDKSHRIRKVSSFGIISTVAGTGNTGYSGDGGPATAADLSSSFGMTVDGSGNLYFADFANYRVRKISTAGIISTVIGNGSSTYSGDGDAASTALSPAAIAVDGNGNLFVSDEFNAGIRKLTTGGLPTMGTISGATSVCAGISITLTDTNTGGVWSSSNVAVATVNNIGVVTGIEAGNTIISHTVSNACGIAHATSNITVNELPAVPIISGAFEVTVGATISLTASVSDGVWNSSNVSVASVSSTGIVAGVTIGSVDISYIVSNTCGSTYSTQSVTVNSLLDTTSTNDNCSSWNNVGIAGFSAGTVNAQVIALDPLGVPYVAYSDESYNNKATVMKYNGTNWVNVGSAGFSSAQVDFMAIAIDSSAVPYVAYLDSNYSNRVTVRKFDGTNWVVVGSAGFSTGSTNYISLAIGVGGIPYVAYTDSANSSKATVMKYNGSGWITVGNAGFSIGSAGYPVIAFNSAGLPFVAYADGADSNRATVMKFNGTNWIAVGNPGFSSSGAIYLSFAVNPSGTPYVAYMDESSTDASSGYKVIVMKFNGANWIKVGNSDTALTSFGMFPNLAFGPTGTPYVSYVDFSLGIKIAVKKFNGVNWSPVGSGGVSLGMAFLDYFAVSTAGTPYVACPDGANSNKLTVQQFTIVPASISGRDSICVGGTTNLIGSIAGGVWSSSDTAIAKVDALTGKLTGIGGGTAIIMYDAGCGTPASFAVTINAIPLVNVVADQTVCNGYSTTLISFSGTGATYSWVNGNSAIGLANSGTGDILPFIANNGSISIPLLDSIKVTARANGCISAEKIFLIIVNPNPVISLNVIPAVCRGTTVATLSYNKTHTDFGFTGIMQTWTVPANIDTLDFNLVGARGGYRNGGIGTPGKGAMVKGKLAVTPGQVLNVFVGGVGATGSSTGATGGYNDGGPSFYFGGGGGGATDVRIGGIYPPNKVIIAGAGGGSGGAPDGSTVNGGDGGGLVGGASGTFSDSGVIAALGGTQTSGGTGARFPPFGQGASGYYGGGGDGLMNTTNTCSGGGGAGYFGGGGGSWSGGGGGSSYARPDQTANVSFTQGYNDSAGYVSLSYGYPFGTTYTITWDAAAHAAGFTDVIAGILPSSSVALPIPTTADTGVYTAAFSINTGMCNSIPQAISVKVNAIPMVNVVDSQVVCNGNTTSLISFSGTGNTYSWTNNDTSIGLTSTGTGNIASFTSVNNSDTIHSATVTVTPFANGCTGSSNSLSITVNPTPVLAGVSNQVFCNGASTALVNFNSPVSGSAYNWTNSNSEIGLSSTGAGNIASFIATNNTNTRDSAIITVTPSANTCNGIAESFTLVVNPTPHVNVVSNQTLCATVSTIPTNFGGSVIGSLYKWINSNNTIGLADTGSGNIGGFASVNVTNVIQVATVTVTPFANNCIGNSTSFTYTVNPIPDVDLIPNQTVCNGASTALLNFGSPVSSSTYSWTNNNGTIGLAAADTGNIASFIATNLTAAATTATITVTPYANNCVGNSRSFEYTVNPTPKLTTTLTPFPVCDSSLFSYLPTSATIGTVFTWSRVAVIGISNSSASGTGDPMEYLKNTTANPLIVVYVDTLFANGCTNTQAVAVIVNPTPKLTSSLTPAAVCNNTVFNYLPTSATVGTTFSWSRAAVSGISNLAATGVDNPAETLVNTTVNQVTVNYVYTLTANGCSFTQVVSVVVNPTPQLSGTTLATVCSNAPLSYHPTSATTVSSFAWTRPVVAGISNAAGTGSGDINELLVNTTLFPKTVVYNYVLTAFGCTNPQNFTVTVNPAPAAPVITINSPSTVCSNTMYQNFGTTPATDSVKYTWTAIGATVYAEGAGHQNSLVNFTTPGTADVILSANINGIACYTRDTFTATVGSAAALNPEVYYVHDHFICLDNTVDSYQWGYDDATTLDSTIYTGEVDQNFHNASPDFTTKKYWVITTKGGCMSKSYYNAPVGIVNVSNVDAVTIDVFPNPASDNVAIAINGINVCNTTIELTDITGKIIVKTSAVDNKTVINVGDIASGVYIVSCYHNGTKVGTTKLVKN